MYINRLIDKQWNTNSPLKGDKILLHATSCINSGTIMLMNKSNAKGKCCGQTHIYIESKTLVNDTRVRVGYGFIVYRDREVQFCKFKSVKAGW